MKYCAISSTPAVAKSVAMFSALLPSGARMPTLKSPATINSAPGGLRPIALTTISMVTSSSGAMYAPTMCQRFALVTTWHTITFGPHLSTASTTKRGVRR